LVDDVHSSAKSRKTGVKVSHVEQDFVLGSLKRTIWGFRDFTGRTRRVDLLIYWIVAAPLSLIVTVNLSKILAWQASLVVDLIIYAAIAIPGFALCVRRLHDQDRSGRWALLFPIGFGYEILKSMWLIIDQEVIHAITYPLPEMVIWADFPVKLAVLILSLWPGTAGENRFGPNPRPKTTTDRR